MTKIVEFPTEARCPADPTGTDPECIECAQKWAKTSVEVIGWGKEINRRYLIRKLVIEIVFMMACIGLGVLMGFLIWGR